MTNNKTIEQNLDLTFKDIKNQTDRFKDNLDVTKKADKIAEIILEQYKTASVLSKEPETTIVFEIKVSGNLIPLRFNEHGLNFAGQKSFDTELDDNNLTKENVEYYEKRLKNRVKDIKDLKLDSLKVNQKNGSVMVTFINEIDLSKVRHFIAKLGVSTFAQHNLKSKALPDPKGIKFVVTSVE